MTAEGSLEDLARRIDEIEQALLKLHPLSELIGAIADQDPAVVAALLDMVRRAGPVIRWAGEAPAPGYG